MPKLITTRTLVADLGKPRYTVAGDSESGGDIITKLIWDFFLLIHDDMCGQAKFDVDGGRN